MYGGYMYIYIIEQVEMDSDGNYSIAHFIKPYRVQVHLLTGSR